jgi:two-component system sensor histidine kinase BaeS
VDVDLTAVMLDAVEVWGDRCQRAGVRLERTVDAVPIVVRADPLRLRQIVDNLAENALRVTPAGGVIVMAARVDEGWGVAEVRDSGPGIAPDDVDVAFEPGILHERYRGLRPVGTGLGLALVGRLASGMGGWARAGTAPEGGAAFAVGVPLATQAR